MTTQTRTAAILFIINLHILGIFMIVYPLFSFISERWKEIRKAEGISSYNKNYI